MQHRNEIERVSLTVRGSDRVGRVKRFWQQVHGGGKTDVQITMGAVELMDDDSLQHYGVRDGALLLVH